MLSNVFAVLSLGIVGGLAAAAGLGPPDRAGPASPAVHATAWMAAGAWLLAVGRDRRLWAAGCGLACLHTAVAFHVVHGWSDAAAFAETERVGGTGYGVYVNYLFLLTWAADAGWWNADPAGYRRRPRWLTWAVVGFLGFIVFNGTIAFGGWAARAVFGGLWGWLVLRRSRRRDAASGGQLR